MPNKKQVFYTYLNKNYLGGFFLYDPDLDFEPEWFVDDIQISRSSEGYWTMNVTLDVDRRTFYKYFDKPEDFAGVCGYSKTLRSSNRMEGNKLTVNTFEVKLELEFWPNNFVTNEGYLSTGIDPVLIEREHFKHQPIYIGEPNQ